MKGQNNDLCSKISKLIYIDKQMPNSMKNKKAKFSSDIIIKRRSHSTETQLQKNKILYLNPFKKTWKSMNKKYKETSKEPNNLDIDELERKIKMNGLNENMNYIYLKKLKNNNDINYKKEFEQYKYTLSYSKRMELSNNPKNEINMNLKNYFENILLLIIDKPSNFDVEKEIKKFNVDFNQFGILINPEYNIEIFYCFALTKFLFVYKELKDQNAEPEYYISFLKDFIKQKDLTPIKCLVLLWIIITINDEADDFTFEHSLKTYNLILMKSDIQEYFCLRKIKGRKNIYKYQKIFEDKNLFIKNSYFGKDFKFIYDFFLKVIRSPLLNHIFSNIEGFSQILQLYDYSDIKSDNIYFFPMHIRELDFGFTQNFLDIILINSLPLNYYSNFNCPANVLSKIHNYFILYTTLLLEQGFHYIKLVFNKLDPDICQDTPKDLFLTLTNDKTKLELLKYDGDGGSKGETLIFGKNNINLKQMFF